MNDRAKDYVARFSQWWKSQSSSKKLRLGGLLVLAMALIVVGWTYLASPNWQPLYTNLNARTAGQITTQLTQMKIPYQLTNGGATVLVPKKDVNQVRVSLADQNIPSSGTVGLPAPLTFSLGETSQEIQLTQAANLEATLQATIDSINGVRSSRVLINQPPPSLFGESPAQSTASVFVTLAPGSSLSAGQVRGVMNLVSHSVAGLSPGQVSVVDQSGTVLSAGVLNNTQATNLTGVSTAELADETAVSNAIRTNVENMLSQVLGPGNAVVQVNATLNFNQSTIQSTNYGHSVLSSQQVQTSTSTGTNPAPAATGTTGNTPTFPTTATTGTSKTNKSTTVSNYLVDTTKTNQTVPAGAIQRVTVAVAVDKKLSAAQRVSLKNLVANAAGLNFKRGDQLTLAGMAFNRTAVNSALKAMAQAQRAQTYRQAAVALAALIGFLAVIFMIRRMLKNRPQAEPSVMTLPTAVGGQDEFHEPMSVAELLNEMRAAKEPTLSDQARQRVDDIAKNDPETAARLLKTWIEEENP